MRVGVDAWDLTRPFLGVGRYLYNLLNHLAPMDEDIYYILYAPEDIAVFPPEGFPNIRKRKIGGFLSSPRELWKQVWLPRAQHQDGIEVFFVPSYTLPYFLNCTTILTIHDLLNLQYPQFATFKQRFIAKISALSAPRAEVVMVPSRYSRSELLRLSNCREASIKVIYHGCDFDFSTTASVEYKDNFKNCEPFFLFVGADYPRRNVPGLIKAFAEVKSELSRPINLIIAGTSTRLKFLQETIKDNNVTDNVRLLGHIDDEMLKYLYLHALAFVYPSRYEGFGMPILEAMSAGLPVIVPDCPPYDEVAGEAGIYFNPDDPEGMKKAMIRVISNPALREEYSQKSRLQASHFSWETAARQILELIKQFEIGK